MKLKRLAAAVAFASFAALCHWPVQAAVDFRVAAKKAIPATVAVEWKASRNKGDEPAATATLTGYGEASLYGTGDAASPPRGRPAMGFVSGTIMSADGLVVTCAVLEPAADIVDVDATVTLADGRQLKAKILINDLRSGLQILKLDARDLPHLTLAKEDAEVGQPVLAAMATDARDRTIARGIITSTNRSAPGLPAAILQSDVQVGAMSAGGPLVDPEGRLLGIIVAKEARRVDQPGPVFAVPGEFVKQALDAVGGDFRPIHLAYLGISLSLSKPHLESVNPELPPANGEEAPAAQSQVMVIKVHPDSPAANAGLAEGDVILRLNGEKSTSAQHLSSAIARRRSGEKVELTVKRGEEVKKVAVTLGERPQAPRPTARAADPNSEAKSAYAPQFPDDVRIIREYKNSALRSAGMPAPPTTDTPAQPLTIRVERSDLEQKVDALHQEVVKLREQIKALQESLEK